MNTQARNLSRIEASKLEAALLDSGVELYHSLSMDWALNEVDRLFLIDLNVHCGRMALADNGP